MKSRPADLLTWFRIGAAPSIAWVAMEGWRDAFYILLIVSLVSDLVDGPLARRLGQQSAHGARLDTWADGLTLLAGLAGLFMLESELFRPQAGWLLGFLLTYALAAATCLIKFWRLPAYHLYSAKAAALLSGIFVVWLYAFGFSRGLLIGTLFLGMAANLESVLVTLRLRAFRTNMRSLLLVEREDK